MAILRGGIRIGGYDVRIGLPRDTSLDNVNTDPRFRQKAGGNPETVMGRFQSYVNEAEGFARKARFYVEFNLPGTKNIISSGSLTGIPPAGDTGATLSTSSQEQLATFKSPDEFSAVQTTNIKRVQAFCSAINMPDRNIEIKEVRHHGPVYKIAHDHKSTDITATFYCDKFLRERSYFELWQSAIYSNQSNNFNFYDNYISDVNIFQLGQFASSDERDDITYAVKLFDCYPKTISAVEYSYDNNAVQTFNVTFAFRYWINYFLDRSGNIELGQPNFRSVSVLSGQGIFGGILDKLPPELRRAGTGVIEQLKRSLPIGKITGGRVQPPLGNIGPLNL